MDEAKLTVRLIVRSAAWIAAMGMVLFAAAGDPLWAQGWTFLALFTVASTAFSVWLMRRDPALLASRLEVVQQGQSGWDRLFLLVFIAIWFGWLALMGLDAARWHTSHMPPLWNVLGGALVMAGFAATARVLRENSFAAPVVRVQQERGQRVIDTGPYAVVRHPMYAASIPYLAGMPLLLGSRLGLLIVPVFVVGIAVRAVFEERLLARDLAGYAQYRARVRWRFIPYLW